MRVCVAGVGPEIACGPHRRGPEPAGGAHRHHAEVMASTAKAITQFLTDFPGTRGRLEVREHRRDKFLAIGTNLS